MDEVKTWDDISVTILPDSEPELLALRHELTEAAGAIRAQPPWWRRKYLNKAQRWDFAYKLALIEQIDKKLEKRCEGE